MNVRHAVLPLLACLALLSSCNPEIEFGGEGAACVSPDDCARNLTCRLGICAPEDAPDAGTDAEAGADTSAPDASTPTPDIGPDTPPDAGPCGTECADPTPVCDAASGSCVECLATTDCTAGVCDTDSNTCVTCLTDTDCTDPTASACDTTTNTCTGCDSSAQCAHLDATTICDGSATCVECLDTDDTTRTACAGNSCDPATNTCTQTPTTSLAACDACLADSECPDNYRCIPMEFQGTPRNEGVGGYCLRAVNMTACNAPFRTILNRASLSGATAEDYCGVAEELTTCEATLDLVADKDCTQASDCGHPNLSDARCELVNFANKCTYNCGASSQCPSGVACGPTTNYCGGT